MKRRNQKSIQSKIILGSIFFHIFIFPLFSFSNLKTKNSLSIKNLFQSSNEKISVFISNIGDSSHIEWKGEDFWSYKIKKISPNKLAITLPPLSQEAEKRLTQWEDQLIEKITIKKSRNKKTYDVIFSFKKEDVKIFDYVITRSSLFITDFYTEVDRSKTPFKGFGLLGDKLKKESKKKKLAKKLKSKNLKQAFQKKDLKKSFKKLPVLKKKKKKEKKGQSLPIRDPAGTEFIQMELADSVLEGGKNLYFLRKGVFDGSDPNYERFLIKDYEIKEDSIIASKKNIYIKFPLLHMTTNRLGEILEQNPEFKIKKVKSKENEEVRFLLRLFKKKKFFSFLKVYGYLIKERPKSYYDEVIRNMAMEVYLRIWIKDKNYRDYAKFKSLTRYLLKYYPKSPLTKRAHLMLAYAALESKNALETIQVIREFIHKYPNFVLINELKQSMAEAYFILEKYDIALSIYKEMEQSIKKTKNYDKTAIKSSYFIGDAYARKRQYKQAVLSYKKSISVYPKYQYVFPNVFYNLAESLFWLGDYKVSLKYFVNFLKYFPSHKYGSYAMTRAGEILEILGADDKKVKGAFMESEFRFKGSPGADVARIRLMSRNMENMKEKEMEQALKDIDEISRSSKLPRISEFVSLMVADGLYRRREYKKSLDYLTEFYYKYFTKVSLEPFKKRILRNISDLIKGELDQGDFLGSIGLFQDYGSSWLRDSDRLDIPFFLAKSYELAGAEGAAQKIYKKTLFKLKKIENTLEEKERRVNENLSTKDSVYLRLASVFIKQREYEKGLEYLKNIKTDQFLSDKERIEKVNFSAIIAEKKGEIERAEAYLKTLTRSWQGNPHLLSMAYLRLAKVQEKMKKYEEADGTLDSLLQLINEMKEENNKSPESEKLKNQELLFQALLKKGEVLEKQNKDISAVEVYMKIINEFDNQKSLGSIRYKIGKILFEKGDIKGAEEIWGELDPERYVMYLNLAKEQLDHSNWKKNINQYIKRSNASLVEKLFNSTQELDSKNL